MITLAKVVGNRSLNLSITHRLCSQSKAELDISQAAESTPNYHVPGRRISRSSEITPEPCQLRDVLRNLFSPRHGLLLGDETI